MSTSEKPVALVTGSGAPRVGNTIARHLSAAGYRLVVHANRSVEQAQQLAEELGSAEGNALAVIGDVSDEAQVKRIFAEIDQQFGRIDALVNCASIWDPVPLEKITAAEVRKQFDVNTLGSFLCAQAAGLRMVSQPQGGSIVNLGDWAVERPYQNYAAYFIAKGSIATMTRTLAVELAARNPRIRVNAVQPGPVMLPDDMPQAEKESVIAQTLVKREGSPDNVADAVLFLLRNDFVTGVCLPVDGGRSVYAP